MKSRLFSIILCVIAVLAACLSLYFMGVYYLPVNDDVTYQFVFGDGDTLLLGQRIKADTFDKIFKSQVFHYLYSNGRALVHVLIQLFAGMLGFKAYTMFSVLLLAAAMILSVRYACPKRLYSNPLVWILVAICYMYLYPSPLGAFYSLVYGMNYLYPMVLVGGFLLIYRCLECELGG